MRVTVMGAGALGGYFGARLAAAGETVTFVARGAHLAAMQAGGLRVESPLGDLHLPQVRAVASPEEAGPADLVLLMVKTYDVEDAADRLAPTLAPGAAVMTVQNGVTAPARVAARIGAERVLAGIVRMPADLKAPGVIRHSAPFHHITLGRPEGSTADPAPAAAAFAAAGIEVAQTEDIAAALWEKFVMLASFAAITCLARSDIGPIRETPEAAALLLPLLEEAQAVGRAVCPTLAADVAARSHGFIGDLPPGTHASMADDLARGRRLELWDLSGEIVRLGRLHAIATPVHAVALGALAPHAAGRSARPEQAGA